MWVNKDLDANANGLVSTGDATLDKLVNQWISWDKVSVHFYFDFQPFKIIIIKCDMGFG